MKYQPFARGKRALSWALTAALLASILPSRIGATPAAGQPGGAAGPNTMTIIVADFVNKEKSRQSGQDLTSWVTDAVAVEMASTSRFEVLKRQEMTRAANELGYRTPYDTAQLTKMAANLGANAFVTGEIAALRVTEGKGVVKTVRLGLRVRLHDASSGDLLNGAAVVGVATAKPGEDGTDALAQQAATMAALQAVKQILNTTLPTGIILNTVGEGTKDLQILINRGSRDGVTAGMEMIVFREQQRIGSIRVTQVFPTDAEARPVEGAQGFRPQDTVRAVFPMPELDTGAMMVRGPRPRSGSSMAALGKILLVIAVGVIIATALKGSSSVTGVTAEADTQSGAPAVRITWRDNLFGGGTLEYHLWRTPGANYNATGIPVQAIPAGQRQVYDYPAPYTAWNGINSYLQAPVTGSAAGTLSTSVTPTAGTGPVGFTAGTTYTYQVSAVLRRTSTSSSTGTTGTTTTQEDVETGLVSSGAVTPLIQPQLTSPVSAQTSVSLSSVNFSWLSVAGADVFQVEISTEQTFMDRTRIVQLPLAYSTVPTSSGVLQPLAGVNLTSSSLNAPLRLDATFANFINGVSGATTPTLWWRVGARNNADRPGPVHWISKSSSDQDRRFRFIYSAAQSFQPAPLPPNPP